ncbi:MAG TPA: D-TA family PLP-dependent enzyme [Devosia sp.]|nr:D-TA family PLP-dependent enzyme [Devosia sp.]
MAYEAEIGQSINRLSTPVPVIDEDIVAANIARVQDYMDEIGRSFRPHIKTHKIPRIAQAQLQAGAKGINCQKVSEAEIFADAGFEDILITYNILGEEKLVELYKLSKKTKLSVCVDSETTIEGLAGTFSPEKALTVLVECDTGAGRCGVQSPERALVLAQKIAASPGLKFGGLMTYPRPDSEVESERYLARALVLLTGAGLDCPTISYGGTPSLFNSHLVPSATEHRAGTYVYNDRAMARSGHCTLEDCAMTILATVVSRPTANRAIIDAGSKGLTSDLLGFEDFGIITEYPKARIVELSEEHGSVDLSAVTGKRPEIGEKLRIIPNHTCVVSNLFDRVVFHKGGKVTRLETIAARGRVW